MKNKAFISMLLTACAIFVCSACGKTESAESSANLLGSAASSGSEAETPEISSEQAMENFVKKLESCNYVVDAEDYLKTTVVSPGEVYMLYHRDTVAEDFAFVTLENETFGGVLNENSLSAEEINAVISEYGLPDMDAHDVVGCRNLTRYRYNISGFKGLFMLVFQEFDSVGEAEAFLDAYTAVLEEQGYYRIDPSKLGSMKQVLYFNEELAKYAAFDLIDSGSSASVNLEFLSIDREDVLTAGAEEDSSLIDLIRYHNEAAPAVIDEE